MASSIKSGKSRAASAPKKVSKPTPKKTAPKKSSVSNKSTTTKSTGTKASSQSNKTSSAKASSKTSTANQGNDKVNLSKESSKSPNAAESARANSLTSSLTAAFSGDDSSKKVETRGIGVESIQAPKAQDAAQKPKEQASPTGDNKPAPDAAKDKVSADAAKDKPAPDAAKDKVSADAAKDKPAPDAAKDKADVAAAKDSDNKQDNRSVFVVDNFDRKEVDIDGDNQPDATHGEVLARGFENQNFNVDRVPIDRTGISGALNKLDQSFENGDKSFKKGDVVNLSVGSPNDPSFSELSEMVGFKVTPENLASKRGDIFGALEKLPPESRVQEMLATNNAITSLQDKGLEVVHAAGNTGKDSVSVGFLNANHQLSGTDAKGQVQPWSGDNSLTKPAQGVLGISEVKNDDGSLAGFDVGRDGTVDFKPNEVSNGDRVVDRFEGKPASVVSQPTKDQGFGDLVNQGNLIPENEAFDRAPGFFDNDPNTAVFPNFSNPEFRFSKDENGKLFHNPDNSGKKGAINSIAGTSFAVLDFLKNALPAN